MASDFIAQLAAASVRAAPGASDTHLSAGVATVRSRWGLYFRPKSIAYCHSISRCALLNAPAGSFSGDIVKIERDRVIVTRVCACAPWRSEMPTGTVKWFNGQKGFGFIQPSDGGNDVFVHISAVERAGLSGLAEGQKVAFEIKADKMRGKTSAENLSVV